LNVVSGGDELGQWMTSHPGLDKIAFTGSTETGKHVMRSAAGSLKRVTLELGGNDPAIVLPDVDPKVVAPQLFWAAFQNNAQFCNSTKRLYVHEDIYDALLSELVAYTRTVKVGDGSQPDTQMGPIQNEPQYRKVIEYFEDSERNHHRFAVGGKIDRNAQGWFIPVTLVDNPPEDSRLVVEEPFGPILPILKWRDEDDVVRRANDTRYGSVHPSGAGISPPCSASAAASRPVRCGSTRCTSTRRTRRLAATRNRAWAARTRCTA
jgi:acyl-CoA reductase-like NAD-dependent aldehyde dehydrogenase